VSDDGAAVVLAAKWSSLDELVAAHPVLRLDLGCGWVKEPGYVGLDDLRGVGGLEGQSPSEERGPDVFLDLNADRWPFPDGSVAEVRSRHFLEHSLLDHVFGESHRVLRPGGSFVAIVPYANSADGMAPGHTVFLTERFFERNPSFQARFAITRITYRQSEEWERWPRLLRRLVPYDWARTHLYNVCKEMRVEAVRR
jgi:SAM-dependent methyltransferase